MVINRQRWQMVVRKILIRRNESSFWYEILNRAHHLV